MCVCVCVCVCGSKESVVVVGLLRSDNGRASYCACKMCVLGLDIFLSPIISLFLLPLSGTRLDIDSYYDIDRYYLKEPLH